MIMSEFDWIKKALRRLRNADVELRRAANSGDTVRINKAGTSYAMAKINLFHLMQRVSI